MEHPRADGGNNIKRNLKKRACRNMEKKSCGPRQGQLKQPHEHDSIH